MLLRRASAEQEFVRRVSSMSGFSTLRQHSDKFSSIFRQSDEIFILGSGASVLDVSDQQWERISSQLSLGFGPWALHPFVPSIFAYGPTRGLKDYDRIISTVMAREDIVAAGPRLLLLRSDNQRDLQTYKSLPVRHHENSYLYGRVNPIAHDRVNLARELAYWHRSKAKILRGVAMDSGSTLVRLISLSLSLGARKIVLVGVDLNTVEYFWQDSPKFLRDNGFKSFDTAQPGNVHDTLLSTNRPAGVVSVIESLGQISNRHLGAEILVASGSSALSSVLPIWN